MKLKNTKTKILLGLVILVIIVIFVILYLVLSFEKNEVEIGGQNIAVVNNGSGLYKDEYIKERYIYRGKNPANYIMFNNELWRIMAVDKDGNIQIIKNDILKEASFDTKGNRGSNGEGGEYCLEVENGCNAWVTNSKLVGSPQKYINGTFSEKVNKDSSLYVDLSNYVKNLNGIVNGKFNLGGVLNEFDLEEMTSQENKNQWNGSVGLISVSDYIKACSNDQCNSLKEANLNYSQCSTDNWMFINGRNWWTLTPYSGSSMYLWYIGDEGYINNEAASEEYGVRPVIYLSDDILLTGEGTLESPYILKS